MYDEVANTQAPCGYLSAKPLIHVFHFFAFYHNQAHHTKMASKTLRLINSANPAKAMPVLGFGTWQSEKGVVGDAVKQAIAAGYRHIDAAAIYGNEAEVGKGIKDSGVNRDEIWITSKVRLNSGNLPILLKPL